MNTHSPVRKDIYPLSQKTEQSKQITTNSVTRLVVPVVSKLKTCTVLEFTQHVLSLELFCSPPPTNTQCFPTELKLIYYRQYSLNTHFGNMYVRKSVHKVKHLCQEVYCYSSEKQIRN